MENSGSPCYALYEPQTIAVTNVDRHRESPFASRPKDPREYCCPHKGCPRSVRGHGFMEAAYWQEHVNTCLLDPDNFCRCLVQEVEEALARYKQGFLEQIERTLLDAIVAAQVPFADPDHSGCDICKKPVLANDAEHDTETYQARNRIRLALADRKNECFRPDSIYTPLDHHKRQIRLLLLSVARDDFILETFDWDAAPPFIAISYTWGPPTPAYNITVNGQPFKIRENLRDLLSTVARRNRVRRAAGRRNAEDKWLWIDQICIDQSNISERNHQVQMMSRIYGSCRGVVVWLGCDYAVQKAISTLGYMSDFDALAVVLRSPYFSRMWIIQEILLNPTKPFLLCGDTELPWQHITFFTRIGGWVDELLRRHVLPSSIFLVAEAVQPRRGSEKRALSTCVYYYSSSLCTDPRDKVYGLLGLIDEAHSPVVDYNKSVMQVFYDAVLAMALAPRDPRPLETGEDNTMVSAILELARTIGVADANLPTRRFVVELERAAEAGIELENGVYSAGQLTRIGHVEEDRSILAHRDGKNYGWWFEYTGQLRKWRIYHNRRGRLYHSSPLESGS